MKRNYLLVGGFSALTAFAAAGWLRPQPASFSAAHLSQFQPAESVLSPELMHASTPVISTALYRERAQPARVQTVQHRYRERGSVYRSERVPERIVEQRSTGKSVAIVAGSSAAGAAIGAMAGGGKGAAIGAVAGGAGGFVYDRVTRDKQIGAGDTYRSGTVYRDDDRERSTGKSVAIVAGSAGTGAAIGAMAGGGKGAAIGALAGGAGGYIFDRVTKRK